MLSLWPWYQDGRTSEEIKRTKGLSTLTVVRFRTLRRKKKNIPKIYCRGSPRDLRETICSKVRPARTACCIHLNSSDAWLLPNDEESMLNKWESMIDVDRSGLMRFRL